MPISDVIADRMVSASVDTLRYGEHVQREVLSLLQDAHEDALAKLAVRLQRDPLSRTVGTQRVRKLIEGIEKSINKGYRDVANTARTALIEVSGLSQAATVGAVNGAIKVDIMSPVLSPSQLKTLATRSMIRGSPAADWWATQKAASARRFASQLRMGILSGESTPEIVRRVRGTVTGTRVITLADGTRKRVKVLSGGIINTSTREATALVRTAIQQVAQETNERVIRENDDITKGVQVVVTLDTRTSRTCIALSGGAWDLNGDPLPQSRVRRRYPGRPPYHFNCRTTIVPVLKSFDELAGLPEGTFDPGPFSGGTRASMDGQVARELNFEDWLKTKPESVQQDVLGIGRWKLWDSGKLELRNLTDVSGRPLTLDQLKKRIARKR